MRIGIDIGGTFTDFMTYDAAHGELRTFKLLSTPHNPAEAVIAGLKQLGLFDADARLPTEIVHGSTVATNALLERKGARMALITTRGFADVIQIGRQNRPATNLYDWAAPFPAPLTPPELRFEVDERVSAEGDVVTPLDTAGLPALAEALHAKGVEAVAVCLLFSFLHPEHEAAIGAALRAAGLEKDGVFLSLSSEILPEYREYERMSTTAINAYVSPGLDSYLSRLAERLGENTPLRIMQSNGGSISVAQARRLGVHCILSGPAGGVIGAQHVAQAAGPENAPMRLITFDMGGTSTDVSLIDGAARLTSEAQISGLPVRIPMLDIHTIGAGGGSIAHLDAGGALRVGPESAGADPGPACYGRAEADGLQPTVTDANLLLGRLLPEHFLGGALPLYPKLAMQTLERLAAQARLDVFELALGIVEVANAHMERALRLISVERGHDPRRFNLLTFGGAGGLHAASLARSLGIPRLFFPPQASTLSALGMLASDVVKDYTQTVMLPGKTPAAQLQSLWAPLLERAQTDLMAEKLSAEQITLLRSLDMRYRGQSYELNIPWENEAADAVQGFEQAYQDFYGYTNSKAEVEIVNLRVQARGQMPRLALPRLPLEGADASQAQIGKRRVLLRTQAGQAAWVMLPVYRAEALRPGNQVRGAALIVRNDTTLLILPGDNARMDDYLNLFVEIGND